MGIVLVPKALPDYNVLYNGIQAMPSERENNQGRTWIKYLMVIVVRLEIEVGREEGCSPQSGGNIHLGSLVGKA